MISSKRYAMPMESRPVIVIIMARIVFIALLNYIYTLYERSFLNIDKL